MPPGEKRAPGSQNPGQPGRADQVLLAGQPCSLLRRVQVDIIRGVDAEADAEGGGFLADQTGRVVSHLDALDELDFQAVKAEILDVVERGQGRRGRSGEGNTGGPEEEP